MDTGMPKPIKRWYDDNVSEHGHYACFAGFEGEIRALDNEFADAYEEMDIGAKLQLYAFVLKLVDEAAREE